MLPAQLMLLDEQACGRPSISPLWAGDTYDAHVIRPSGTAVPEQFPADKHPHSPLTCICCMPVQTIIKLSWTCLADELDHQAKRLEGCVARVLQIWAEFGYECHISDSALLVGRDMRQVIRLA